MSNTGTNLKFNALREVAFGAITNGYVVVNPEVINPLRYVVFKNATDTDIYVSLDGVTDNLWFPSNSFELYDLKTNDVFIENQFLYIKYGAAAATSGKFVIESAFS